MLTADRRGCLAVQASRQAAEADIGFTGAYLFATLFVSGLDLLMSAAMIAFGVLGSTMVSNVCAPSSLATIRSDCSSGTIRLCFRISQCLDGRQAADQAMVVTARDLLRAPARTCFLALGVDQPSRIVLPSVVPCCQPCHQYAIAIPQ